MFRAAAFALVLSFSVVTTATAQAPAAPPQPRVAIENGKKMIAFRTEATVAAIRKSMGSQK